MKTVIAVLAVVTISVLAQTNNTHHKPQPAKSAQDGYIDRQLVIINTHRNELVKMGRMSADFTDAERVLSQYGWHSGNASSTGSRAPLWLLQEGAQQGGGSFGAYGPLRLDQKSPAFMSQHGVIIKPADWVDMCECTTTTTVPHAWYADRPSERNGRTDSFSDRMIAEEMSMQRAQELTSLPRRVKIMALVLVIVLIVFGIFLVIESQ